MSNEEKVNKKFEHLSQLLKKENEKKEFLKFDSHSIVGVISEIFKQLKGRFPEICEVKTEATPLVDSRYPSKYIKTKMTVESVDEKHDFDVNVKDIDNVTINYEGKKGKQELNLKKLEKYWTIEYFSQKKIETKEELVQEFLEFINWKIS